MAATLTLVPAPDEEGAAERTIPLNRVPTSRGLAALTGMGRMGVGGGLVGGRFGQRGMGPIAGPIELLSVLGAPALTAAAGVAVGWLQGRNGRKVRMKVGDTEVEARTVAELKDMLELAKTVREKPPEEKK